MANSNKLVTLATLEEFNAKKTKNIFVTADGDTLIKNNFLVEGETTTVNRKNLTINDNQIIANYDAGNLVGEAGFVVKTGSLVEMDSNGTEGETESLPEAYGITYNPIKEVNGVRLGLGIVKDGNFEFIEDQAQFVATRADEIPDGSIIAWDADKHTLVEADLSAYNTTIEDLKAKDTAIETDISDLRTDMEEAATIITKSIEDVAATAAETDEKLENTITNDIGPLKTDVQLLLAILKDELIFDCGDADVVVATLGETELE